MFLNVKYKTLIFIFQLGKRKLSKVNFQKLGKKLNIFILRKTIIYEKDKNTEFLKV